jgi:hypothetical protein
MIIGKLMRLDKAFDSYLKKGLENAKKILEAQRRAREYMKKTLKD